MNDASEYFEYPNPPAQAVEGADCGVECSIASQQVIAFA